MKDFPESVEEDLKKLKEGESLIGLYDTDKGSFLMIGNEIANHCWAVTVEELRKLYELLKKRYK